MRYATSTAFRTALGDRLRNMAVNNPSVDVERLRKSVAIERFLARLLVEAPGTWILKGGVALDYRMRDRARTTFDLDLETGGVADEVVSHVLSAADVVIDDYFSYSARRIPLNLLDEDVTAIRFRIEATLGGRRFETTTLDVGVRDIDPSVPDRISSRNLLDFADIPAVELPVIPLTQHVAEKLHAYSRIYAHDRPSSRVKDLVDIVLIVSEYEFEAGALREEIARTFGERNRHEQPAALVPPPEFWRPAYRQMAGEIGLDPDIDEGFRIAAAFFDPLLANDLEPRTRWSPDQLEWSASTT